MWMADQFGCRAVLNQEGFWVDAPMRSLAEPVAYGLSAKSRANSKGQQMVEPRNLDAVQK